MTVELKIVKPLNNGKVLVEENKVGRPDIAPRLYIVNSNGCDEFIAARKLQDMNSSLQYGLTILSGLAAGLLTAMKLNAELALNLY